MTRFVAPGRVNLMGDHTDYNDGFVLPIAIDRACAVSAERSKGWRLRARSAQLPGEAVISLEGEVASSSTPEWGHFVAGVASILVRLGIRVPAADIEITSTVPTGAGLSSSSALSVALTLALGDLAGASLDRIDIARIASAGEIAATGVHGGLMDQLVSLFGQADHALLIDCRGVTIEPIPIASGVAVIIVHSGVTRTLAGSEYEARRTECAEVARRLGVDALRDATPEQVADIPRARHVVAENARVGIAADALARGDLAALGPLLLASHASLRDDFQVSTPELDTLVEILVECGAAGERLTGAGFGGCVVAVAQRNHADDVVAKTVLRYRARTGVDPLAFVAQAVDGARQVT